MPPSPPPQPIELPEACVERGARGLAADVGDLAFDFDSAQARERQENYRATAEAAVTAALDLSGSATGEDALTRMARGLSDSSVIDHGDCPHCRKLARRALSALLGGPDAD